MYNYKTLAIIGLACATTSALTVPNVLPSELWSVRSTDHDSDNTMNARESGDNSGMRVGETSHSYDPSYEFRSSDGWESVPITNLSYKYGNVTHTHSDQRRQRSGSKRGVKVDVNADVIGGTVSHAVGEAWNELKGLGKVQEVTITWYTGEDLQNPSCWPESDWAPTVGCARGVLRSIPTKIG
ncbi:hypothetical protein OPQ81_004746 [Rhizoctonia solani]|nr:hypothetical protein OPQ81_004746 [Rhizoctonia solani]